MTVQLTPKQRAFLRQLEPRDDFPGYDPKNGFEWRTAYSLRKHGLIRRLNINEHWLNKNTWFLTEAGKAALKEIEE